jgi:hypothetical protein
LAEIIADEQGVENIAAFRKGLQGGIDVMSEFKNAYKYMEKFGSIKAKKEFSGKESGKSASTYSNGASSGKGQYQFIKRCHICKQEGYFKANCPNCSSDNKP